MTDGWTTTHTDDFIIEINRAKMSGCVIGKVNSELWVLRFSRGSYINDGEFMLNLSGYDGDELPQQVLTILDKQGVNVEMPLT